MLHNPQQVIRGWFTLSCALFALHCTKFSHSRFIFSVFLWCFPQGVLLSAARLTCHFGVHYPTGLFDLTFWWLFFTFLPHCLHLLLVESCCFFVIFELLYLFKPTHYFQVHNQNNLFLTAVSAKNTPSSDRFQRLVWSLGFLHVMLALQTLTMLSF